MDGSLATLALPYKNPTDDRRTEQQRDGSGTYNNSHHNMALSAQKRSEGFTYNNGFVNKLVYTDEHNSQPTTVTTSGDDQGFKGERLRDTLFSFLGRLIFNRALSSQEP